MSRTESRLGEPLTENFDKQFRNKLFALLGSQVEGQVWEHTYLRLRHNINYPVWRPLLNQVKEESPDG